MIVPSDMTSFMNELRSVDNCKFLQLDFYPFIKYRYMAGAFCPLTEEALGEASDRQRGVMFMRGVRA